MKNRLIKKKINTAIAYVMSFDQQGGLFGIFLDWVLLFFSLAK